MEEKSRTEHSVQNTTTAIIAKMIALLTGFITRVVFTHCLSQTYVGINGLFWDILNVFSSRNLAWERQSLMPYMNRLRRVT